MKTLLLRLSMLLLSSLLCPLVARAAEPVYVFEDDGSRGIDARFQGWHSELEDEGDYGESWFFMAQTAQQGFLFVLLSVTNLGLRTFDCSYDIDYYPADGGVHHFHRECVRDDIHGTTTGMDITMGEAHAWGGAGSYRVTVDEGGTRLDLRLQGELPAYKFGNGKVQMYADRSAEWTLGINAPRARTSGSLTMDGQTFDLTGVCFYDHGGATEKLPTYLSRWFTLRVYDTRYSLVLHHHYLSDKFGGGAVKFGMFGDGDQLAATSRNFRYLPVSWRTHDNGMRVPTEIQVLMNAGGCRVEGTVSEVRFLEAVDVLAALSWPVRTAIRTFYSDVWLMRLVGHYELDITAHFIKTWELTTGVSPTGGGTVTPASGTYDDGEVVSVTADEAAGYRFDHWEGNVADRNDPTTTVSMRADQTITAHFMPIE